MFDLHSTYLKKIFSENVETNALRPVNLISSEVVQPTIELQPDVIVFTATFTTDANRDFFVTDISQNAAADAGVGGAATIVLTAADNTIKNFKCQSDTTGSQNRYTHFSKKGLKLKRNTSQQIGTTNGGDDACIVGYYGSDRV